MGQTMPGVGGLQELAGGIPGFHLGADSMSSQEQGEGWSDAGWLCPLCPASKCFLLHLLLHLLPEDAAAATCAFKLVWGWWG